MFTFSVSFSLSLCLFGVEIAISFAFFFYLVLSLLVDLLFVVVFFFGLFIFLLFLLFSLVVVSFFIAFIVVHLLISWVVLLDVCLLKKFVLKMCNAWTLEILSVNSRSLFSYFLSALWSNHCHFFQQCTKLRKKGTFSRLLPGPQSTMDSSPHKDARICETYGPGVNLQTWARNY